MYAAVPQYFRTDSSVIYRHQLTNCIQMFQCRSLNWPVSIWTASRTAYQWNDNNLIFLLSTFNAYATLWSLLSEIRYLTLTNYALMTFGDAKGAVTTMHFKKILLFTIMGECTKLNEACNIISVVGRFNTFHFNLKAPQAKSDESNLISCSQKTLKRDASTPINSL